MGRIKKSALLLCMGILAVLGSIAAGAKQAEAYTLEKDFNGIYGKEMPSYILKNVEPLFRKHVDKAVKKYNKYAQLREDDYVSYTKKVSKEDNKLGELMKKVKDDDVLRICRPFTFIIPGIHRKAYLSIISLLPATERISANSVCSWTIIAERYTSAMMNPTIFCRLTARRPRT